MRDVVATLAFILITATPSFQWAAADSGVEARFRGVSAVSGSIAWASGTNGTVVRTLDGGATWRDVSIAAAAELDLRDIDAFGADVAYALSIGSGADSRIFKTTDGGETWTPQFVNEEAEGFFDAMSFWDAERGVAVSDSIGGRFYVLVTENGGRTWSRVDPEALPPALPGEGYFAASGTNVTTWGTQHVWFGTGAAGRARVGRSIDGGRSWEVSDTPLPAGPSTGIFSIAFRDANHGVVVGGDYQLEEQAIDNVAFTSDGGRTWTLSDGLGLSGFRSAVGYLSGATTTLVAVGPSGADVSRDDGRSWSPMQAPMGLHTFGFPDSGVVGWAAGNSGAVAKLDMRD